MRNWHRLKKNKCTELPSVMYFYDTETIAHKINEKDTEHELKLGVVCRIVIRNGKIIREDWKTFFTQKEFWDFILEYVYPKKKIYVFAHNQHFDFPVVHGWDFIKENNADIIQLLPDSNRFVLSFRYGQFSFSFIDTFNYSTLSLKQIAKSIGLEKLEVDFDSVSDKDLIIYCKRDVEIIKDFILLLIDFMRKNDLGNFKNTIAGLSFNAYRHKFMKKHIFIHCHKYCTDLERISYRGGRNECFRIGKINTEIYKLDINSMYPFVMKYNKYPTKMVKYCFPASLNGLESALERFEVISEVNITVNEPCIGVKRDNKLVFPIGTFNATLTKPELLYVKENGKINDVIRYAIYESHDIFSEYVDFFYNYRKKFKSEGNLAFAFFTKIFMNSLYGKFGERYEDWKKIRNIFDSDYEGFIELLDFDTQELTTYRKIGENTWKKIGYRESPNSFPAIASYVTAYSRMYLYSLMKMAGLGNVYYVDTDSLFVNKNGYLGLRKLLDDNDLGKLKLEGINCGVILKGCKDYEIGNEIKIKGVKKNATWLDETTIVQEQFLKTKTMMRKKNLTNAKTRMVEKTLSREYTKGNVNPFGIVEPFVLQEI